MYKVGNTVKVKEIIPNPEEGPIFVTAMDISKGNLYKIKRITPMGYLVLRINGTTWTYYPSWVTSKPKLSFKTLKEY